jgi:hypothetical protein
VKQQEMESDDESEFVEIDDDIPPARDMTLDL